jgi:hypothetical protein
VKELDILAWNRAWSQQEKQLKEDFQNERNAYNWLLENKTPVGQQVCPIYSDSVLDPNGLRLWNNENRGVEVR